jgi:beta-glucuronidase
LLLVDNKQANPLAHVRFLIPELGVSESVDIEADGRGRFSVGPLPIELWSPDSPRLYGVAIETELERLEDRVGFRTVEIRGEDILLNGQPIYLRGINSHEEAPMRPGRAHSIQDVSQILDWVADLNANFLRLAHYTHNERIVRLADERGILLWCEIPVYWNINFGSAPTLSLAKQMLEEMIERDKNRAAVVLWSVANETPRTEERRSFLGQLIEHVRALDSTRLVTAALLPTMDRASLAQMLDNRIRGAGQVAESFAITLDDPLGDYLDVIGHNEYYGWYYSSPISKSIGLPVDQVRDAMLAAMPDFRWSMPFNKPLILSEFGAGAKHGFRGDEDDVWTEEYQARLYRAQLAMIDKIPFVRGTAPWILRDFRSPMRQLGDIQDGWNRKGVISSEGQKKLAFEVLRDHYDRKAAAWSHVSNSKTENER